MAFLDFNHERFKPGFEITSTFVVTNNYRMKDTEITNLLHNANLRVTKSRKEVLQALSETGDQAISSNEIEQKLSEIDRITLYRILKAYEDAGLVHSIADGTGKKKYAMCSSNCSEGDHQDNHVHFYCRVCDTTSCLNVVIPTNLKFPTNYLVEEQQFVVSGICKDCHNQ